MIWVRARRDDQRPKQSRDWRPRPRVTPLSPTHRWRGRCFPARFLVAASWREALALRCSRVSIVAPGEPAPTRFTPSEKAQCDKFGMIRCRNGPAFATLCRDGLHLCLDSSSTSLSSSPRWRRSIPRPRFERAHAAPSGREMAEGAAGSALTRGQGHEPFAAASGVVLCAALAIANAHATDGRILMVGSVIAPTCAPAGLRDRSTGLAHALHIQCPDDASAPHYTLNLEPASASRVRLVEYYDGYVRASGSGRAVRVATQTYE